MQRITGIPDLAEPDGDYDSYAAVVMALGQDSFGPAVFDWLGRRHAIDEIFAYIRPAARQPRCILSAGGIGRSSDRVEAYSRQYYPLDPVARLLPPAANVGEGCVAIRVRAEEIADPGYRERCFEAPGLAEKLSLARPCADGWIVLSAYRHRRRGYFNPAEQRHFHRLGAVLLPLIQKHGDLLRGGSASVDPMAEIERRLAARLPALSARERAVCARTLGGMTAEAIALDLGIKPSSVQTYRKRAYARLGISSASQLIAAVLHPVDRIPRGNGNGRGCGG